MSLEFARKNKPCRNTRRSLLFILLLCAIGAQCASTDGPFKVKAREKDLKKAEKLAKSLLGYPPKIYVKSVRVDEHSNPYRLNITLMSYKESISLSQNAWKSNMIERAKKAQETGIRTGDSPHGITTIAFLFEHKFLHQNKALTYYRENVCDMLTKEVLLDALILFLNKNVLDSYRTYVSMFKQEKAKREHGITGTYEDVLYSPQQNREKECSRKSKSLKRLTEEKYNQIEIKFVFSGDFFLFYKKEDIFDLIAQGVPNQNITFQTARVLHPVSCSLQRPAAVFSVDPTATPINRSGVYFEGAYGKHHIIIMDPNDIHYTGVNLNIKKTT